MWQFEASVQEQTRRRNHLGQKGKQETAARVILETWEQLGEDNRRQIYLQDKKSHFQAQKRPKQKFIHLRCLFPHIVTKIICLYNAN